MPLIKIDDLNEDLEDKAAPRGQYDLRVLKSEYVETKKGGDFMLKLMLRVEGEGGEGVKPINLFLMDPEYADDSAKKRGRLRDFKRFATAFGVDYSQGFDMKEQAEQLTGLTASNITLTEEEFEGSINNRVQLPRVA